MRSAINNGLPDSGLYGFLRRGGVATGAANTVARKPFPMDITNPSSLVRPVGVYTDTDDMEVVLRENASEYVCYVTHD
jgi:hypothetical protein